MSDLAQFKNFPKEWNVMTFLDAIKDVTGGNTKIKQSDACKTGIYPVIDQGQQACCGYVDDDNALCKEELPTVLFGDHTKIIKLIDYPFVLGADGVKVLSPKVPMDKKFLFHFLKTIKLPVNAGYSRHYKFLKEAVIPVPPLAEQIRIAAILDKADSLRRKNQQAIQLADQFLRAVFLDTFGDPVTNPKGWNKGTITAIADVITGHPFRSAEFIEDGNDSVQLCRGANTLTGYFDWSDTVYWSKNKLSGLEGYLIEEGDVILAMDRPWISSGLKVCVAESMQREVYLVQRVARLRPIKPVYSDFIYSCIKSKAFESHCRPTETTVPHISPVELKEFEIILPDEAVVEKYHEIVLKVRKLIRTMRLGNFDAELGFNALSQKAFAGEL